MKPIERLGTVQFKGDIHKSKDISAVEVVGDELILLASDEGNLVQVLKRQDEKYKVAHDVVLGPAAGEIDIEGIAFEEDSGGGLGSVYVIGSHALVRKKVKADRPHAEQLEALRSPAKHDPDRDRLCRFRLDTGGNPSPVETTSLRSFIANDPVLKQFSSTAAKENGVDFEGVAVRDGRLVIGCRGPVLRGNWTPAVRCRFAAEVTDAEVVFIDLGGRGFRDLTRVADGFLVLAGPVGDGPGSYQVHWWDGNDCLPGPRVSGQAGRSRLLGEVAVEGEAKPEGMALLQEGDSAYEVLMVFDGVKDGGPTRFRIPKL